MKKYFFFFLLLLLLIVPSCKRKNNQEITKIYKNEPEELLIAVGETYLIEPITENVENPVFEVEIANNVDNNGNNIIRLEGFNIIGENQGTATIYVKLAGFDPWEITVNVYKVEINDIVLDYEETTLAVGETMTASYHLVPDVSAEVTFTTSSKAIATIDDNGLITGIAPGSCNITIRLKENYKIYARFKLDVYIPDVSSIDTEYDNLSLGFDTEYQLEWQVLPIGAVQDVRFESSNTSVATINEDGMISSLYKGKTIIKIISVSNPYIYKEIEVSVDGPTAISLEISSTNLSLDLGEKVLFNYTILPADAYQHLDISYDGVDAIKLKDGYLTALKSGNYTIRFKTIDGSNLEQTLVVDIKQEELPVFRTNDSYNKEVTINWNYDFNLLFGIYAYDSEDGELTTRIEVISDFDSKILGDYEITYKISDSDHHIVEMKRTIHVKWLYKTMVIGHAGSYYGVANSEQAILAAARDMHYPAIEIDVKQTKDGVFVLSHDPEFGGYQLDDYDWEFLKDIEVTVTRNKGLVPLTQEERTYTGKLCTLERYLEICKEYNIIAVIELKTSNGISNWTETSNPTGSRMPALMEVIENAGMEHNVIFLSSQYECLYWTRKNGYEYIPCQYLVNDLSNYEYYNLCRDYKLDISTNVRDGIKITDGWLNIYRNAGIKISTYTFEEYASYEDVQTWIDRGVDFVTCDWHDMNYLDFHLKDE